MVTEEHRSAFREIKAEFAKEIVLPYFSTEKECTLQVDASKKGFGAVLLQDENPVYYASRTLSNAEKNYQNLERECMAAVWGMEKFHYILYAALRVADRSEASSFHIQEAYDRCISKDPEISYQNLEL